MLTVNNLKKILNKTIVRNTINVTNYSTFRGSLNNFATFNKARTTRQSQEVVFGDQFTSEEINNNNNDNFNRIKSNSNNNLNQEDDILNLNYLPEIKKSIIALPTENSEKVLEFMAANEVSLKSKGSFLPDPIIELKDAPFTSKTKAELLNKFQEPTPVQSLGWPIALSGKDMLAVSKTGSGKTLSFILPAIQHILEQPRQPTYYGPSVLVVAPTRELACQIHEESNSFLRANRINSALVYGGDSRGNQLYQFRYQPKIVIGTPGRILDFVDSGSLSIKNVSFMVVDEADRLLEMGFGEDMENIFNAIRPDRQVLYWSATWPKKVSQLASKFIQDPIHIQIGSSELSANKNITQKFSIVDKESQKVEKLLETLEEIYNQNENARTLIFTMTKKGAETLTEFLGKNGDVRIDCLHGDKNQRLRTNTVNRFKEGKLDIVVATDVASRGLDIKNITDVINFSLPPNCETYVHRIGRTARAGATGNSHSILSKESINDTELIGDLINLLKLSDQQVPSEFYDFIKSNKGNSYNNNRNGYGNNRNRDGGRGGRGGYGGYGNNRNRDGGNRSNYGNKKFSRTVGFGYGINNNN